MNIFLDNLDGNIIKQTGFNFSTKNVNNTLQWINSFIRACLNFAFEGEKDQFLVLAMLILSGIAALLREK